MEKGPKFIVGDLVSYSLSSGNSALGVIVESETHQGNFSFMYTVCWCEPYEMWGGWIKTDEVYEHNLLLLSRLQKSSGKR